MLNGEHVYILKFSSLQNCEKKVTGKIVQSAAEKRAIIKH